MKTNRAFTLIELLVVLVIIALLAVMAITVAGPFQRNAQFTQGMSNMKSLASGLMNYCGEHDGELPANGEPEPGWDASIGDVKPGQAIPWYIAVPKQGGGRALGQFEKQSDFYHKSNMLFVPAGTYPESKMSRPYFGIAMNQKLREKSGGGSTADEVSVRLQSMQAPARTAIFFESGLPGEDTLPGQSGYTGSALGDARSVVARYNRSKSTKQADHRDDTTNIVFADGHVEALAAKFVVDSNGNAHFPQLEQDNGNGRVCWTIDPATNPN